MVSVKTKKLAIEELFRIFLNGRLSRMEVANIANDLLEHDDRIRWLALNALSSATVGENFIGNSVSSYYIRDNDLSEWYQSLLGNDKVKYINSEFKFIRPHQLKTISNDAIMAISISPNKIAEFLGQEDIRSLDSLDYFSSYTLEESSGVQIHLQNYPRGTKDIYQIYAGGDDKTQNTALKKLLKYLHVEPNQVLVPLDSSAFFS